MRSQVLHLVCWEVNMLCPICKMVEMTVREGKAEQLPDGTYWVQVFTCNNPNTEHQGKDILKVKTNVIDNSKVITEELY